MSEENLYKQKFKVDQLPTSKIVLYPTRASVVRQIEGVKLQAGLNEITISDLTSLADPDSIRVAGTTDNHPARINDLTVDLVPNNQSPVADFSDSDSEYSEDEEDEEPASLKAATEAVNKVEAKIEETNERLSSTRSELSFLEEYASTVASSTTSKTTPNPETMGATLDLYNKQRAEYFDITTKCSAVLVELEKERVKKQKVLEKEKRAFARVIRAKVERRKKKQAEKEERKAEKKEQKPEVSQYVHRVRITIELPSADLTAHESNTDAAEVFQEAILTLTYTTTSASWTPHYDLRLDTTNPSLSSLTYRAHFTNRTYETWSQAAITLSTSQASFGGLKEKIPRMEGWRVTLAKKWNTTSAATGENGLYSLAELKAKEAELKEMYGTDLGGPELQRMQRLEMLAFEPSSLGGAKRAKKSKAVISVNVPRPSAPPMLFGASRASVGGGGGVKEEVDDDGDNDMGFALFDDGDGATVAPGARAMQHSLAGSDTYGFTTTYELPTPRTIPSSPLVRRHVIAEIPLPSLLFTHIVIPKLKAAAFLKAKLTNTSNVPLLPGQAGLTLDGSFMGNLEFPHCSSSEMVVLELGVDQSVKVEYERPTVKHGTHGMILTGKEEVGAFNRTMRITNSKSSTVSLVVLDQVPVPEDERLKVNIIVPRGLKDVDDVVKSGVGVDAKTPVKGAKKQISTTAPAPPSKLDSISETASIKNKTFGIRRRESVVESASASGPKSSEAHTEAKSGSSWGTAKAVLKKNGEIRWDVDLYKGGCVGLALEWECRMPNGDGVQALS